MAGIGVGICVVERVSVWVRVGGWEGGIVGEDVIDVLGYCRVEARGAGAACYDGDVFGRHCERRMCCSEESVELRMESLGIVRLVSRNS